VRKNLVGEGTNPLFSPKLISAVQGGGGGVRVAGAGFLPVVSWTVWAWLGMVGAERKKRRQKTRRKGRKRLFPNGANTTGPGHWALGSREEGEGGGGAVGTVKAMVRQNTAGRRGGEGGHVRAGAFETAGGARWPGRWGGGGTNRVWLVICRPGPRGGGDGS